MVSAVPGSIIVKSAKLKLMQPKRNKIIDFIQYHNAFILIVLASFITFSIALAASPDLRESFVSTEENIESIDNSYILNINLNNFDLFLQIQSIKEDNETYYIAYTFKTIAIEDGAWQEVTKEKTLTVDKEVLDNKDLGIYVSKELSEVANWELSYLKEVQEIEKEKGKTNKIVSTQYAGLLGRFLNPKEKVFPGYEPVIVREIKIDESVPADIESFDEAMLEIQMEDFLISPSTDSETAATTDEVAEPVPGGASDPSSEEAPGNDNGSEIAEPIEEANSTGEEPMETEAEDMIIETEPIPEPAPAPEPVEVEEAKEEPAAEDLNVEPDSGSQLQD